MRATHRVAQLLDEESKPFCNAEFVRKCLQHTVQEICPENQISFHTENLSRATMRRVEDTKSDLLSQLGKTSKRV